MDFDPISGLLFAVLNDAVGGGGLPKFLATIDTNTGTVTIIHSTVESFDAIACAFPSTVAIPTLPQWGMILLVLSLLAMATWHLAGQLALSGVGTGGTTIVPPQQRWLSSVLLGQVAATRGLVLYGLLVGPLVPHDGIGALLAGLLVGVMIEGYRRGR